MCSIIALLIWRGNFIHELLFQQLLEAENPEIENYVVNDLLNKQCTYVTFLVRVLLIIKLFLRVGIECKVIPLSSYKKLDIVLYV